MREDGASPYTWNNLTSRKVSANSNDKTKHCQASVEDLCLRGKSEFHFVSP